mgnify:CR=1 FL=1|jgi:hypothetical protein
MTTLSQIRKNKEQNTIFNEELQKNYQNPTALSLISKMIKKENIKIINKISKENYLDIKQKEDLLNIFIKPNYYIPYVVNSETKEKLQQLI